MKHARTDYDRIQDPAGKIPDNEPVFLLRGQDISAPVTLEVWAALNDANAGDPLASVLARQQAARMRLWQRHTCKPADLPSSER